MSVQILVGDCRERLRELPDQSVNCCVTSPPYFGLRSYLPDGHPSKALEMGQEQTPDEFVAAMVEVFREVRRVLRDDGTLWLNIGDSYANDGKWGGSTGGKHVAGVSGKGGPGRRKTTTGLKGKDLIGIPWMLAFALRADGWWLREDIVWHKPNCMPDPAKDRCTRSHEIIFHLSKSARYYHDAEAIAEDAVSEKPAGNGYKRGHRLSLQNTDGSTRGSDEKWSGIGGKRNKRSVWTVPTRPFKEAHFATFPPALIEPCILAGCPVGGTVLDPFGGAGTTGLVADRLQRNAVLIDLHSDFTDMADRRITRDRGQLLDIIEAAA